LKFLFVAAGYPGTIGAGSGSGIGTYLRESCLGLTARGHECHVIVWRAAESDGNSHQQIDGVVVHLLPHAYWPVIERFAPDSRDVYNVRRAVRRLERQYGFDWIEIESEEGIAIGVQRDFPKKTILRIHTSLEQMVYYKEVPLCRKTRYRLARERRSFRVARRIVTHSECHARELRERFPFIGEVDVVPHGIGVQESRVRSQGSGRGEWPMFLVVGTADRRKGFDRLRGVLECYAGRYGTCRMVIVSRCGDDTKREYGLTPPFPDGVEVEWLCDLNDAEMGELYESASVLFHPARYESFGLPLIEAAAAGLPVVATEVGVAPDLLSGELAHCLVDGDDPGNCADALHKACAGAESVSRSLRERYLSEFTRDVMTERYLGIVEKGLRPCA